MSDTTTATGKYAVRRYDPGDRDGFLDLYRTVWGKDRGRDWFAWRFEDNPYLDHVPMFVAERDGDVVGTRPFKAFPVHVAGDRRLALLTVDTMVHPDHRRNGLFTRMTERAVEFYADREPTLCFNQPNADALVGFEKLGWRPLDPMVTHYRVQYPGALVADRTDDHAARALGRVADAGARAYLRVRDRPADDGEFDVTSQPGVAADVLADCYRRSVPDDVHAVREPAFYDWRFASPEWDRRSYVARDDGDPVAGILARSRVVHGDVHVTQVADVAPLAGDDRWRAALRALLHAVIRDHPDADLVAAPDRGLPADLLADFGFHSDGAFPLSRFRTADCRLAVRPLGDDWEQAGVALDDPANWRLTFAERDTT